MANDAGPKSKKKGWSKTSGDFKDKTDGNEAEKKPASTSAGGRASKLYDGK